jgi:hypothetical protein
MAKARGEWLRALKLNAPSSMLALVETAEEKWLTTGVGAPVGG